MKRLQYGTQGQVSFKDWHEYYFALGFIANGSHAEIRWEHNEDQGAWGSEGRIHCLVPETMFPQNFRFTAGRGSVYARINCNDYVGTLVLDHNFTENTKYHNLKAIQKTVPEEYAKDFEAGYGQIITFDPSAYMKSSAGKTSKTIEEELSPKQTVKRADEYESIVPGTVVLYTARIAGKKVSSLGTVVEVNREKHTIIVDVDNITKKLAFPGAFKDGFLIEAK